LNSVAIEWRLRVACCRFPDEVEPGRLFHPEYRRSFRFGAVTLRPGMTTADVTAALRSIVADATAD
jgi:hypothetical protein